MQQLEISMTRRKLIGKLSIILVIAVVLLTFLSKTINNSLMPKVTTTQFIKGSLQEEFEADGTVELSDKHKIYAGNSWKVKEVAVKVNQQVKKGDLLAVIGKKDIEVEMKTKKLELIRLENELQNYKNNFKPIQLSDYERDLQLAQRDLSEAKKNLDLIIELYEVGCETKKNLEGAENSYNDKLYLYQSKKDVLESKNKESTYQRDEFNRAVNEKTAGLELKKLVLEKESEDFPEDGRILSDMDGLITAVSIEPGMNTILNQAIFEIADVSCPYRMIWYLNTEKASSYAVGSDVNLEITGEANEEGEEGIKTVTVKAQIAGKEFLTDLDRFKFWVDIDKDVNDAKIAVVEGQKTKVWAVLNSPTYNYLLPKSSVTQIQGKDYIYTVEQRQGALGVADYVEQIEIKIIEEDDFNIAIEGLFIYGESVVVSTTKPLSNGIQVYVR